MTHLGGGAYAGYAPPPLNPPLVTDDRRTGDSTFAKTVQHVAIVSMKGGQEVVDASGFQPMVRETLGVRGGLPMGPRAR